MFRKLLATAAVLGLSAPAMAAVDITATYSTVQAIPSNNDFQAKLIALGLNSFASTGATLTLNGAASVTFDFLGSESGFNDTFSFGSITLTETSLFEDHFTTPIRIGTTGIITSLAALTFSTLNPGGAPATIGTGGFGIFLPGTCTPTAPATTCTVRGGSYTSNVFYLGYDDQVTNVDDNHDDFIVRVTVNPVPEPATWAMMIGGMGIAGAALRRRRRNAVAQVLA